MDFEIWRTTKRASRRPPQNDEMLTEEQESNGARQRKPTNVNNTHQSKDLFKDKSYGSISLIRLSGSILFIIILMIAGILIVCFTSPKPRVIQCVYTLVSENQDWIGDPNRKLPIALGDINNDKHLDIVITQRDTNKIQIFFGYGNGLFPDEPIQAAISSSIPHSIVVSDFSNDSLLDIAVANYAHHSIGIFLGYGNGQFQNETTVSTGPSLPSFLVVYDFNNDKRLDIIVVNDGTNDIGILLGYGNGTFADPIKLFTGFDSNPRAVVIGDFNNDNKSDIVVANAGTNSIGLFLGNDDGKLSNQFTFPAGGQCVSLAIGDFNNDNYLDIVVTNDDVDNIQILLGYGNGTFVNRANYTTGVNSNPNSVVVNDFDKNGRLDVMVVYSVTNALGLFLGNGDGTFKSQRVYPIRIGPPQIIAAGDLNNDSWIDIVFTVESSYNLGIFLGGPDKNFSNMSTYSTGGHSVPYSTALAYFNNDTKLDFVMVNYGISDMRVFLGDGYGGFILKFVYSTGEDSGPVSVAVGDLNNDGRMDIVVAMYTNGKIGIYFGHGDGTFSNQIVYLIDPQSAPMSVAIGDLNNDKIQDIVVANSGTNNIAIMLGNGDGNFSDMILCPTGLQSVPYSVIISDFDQDHNMDMAVAYNGVSILAIFIGFGNGTFIDAFEYFSDLQPYSVAVGDFNNDKKQDIAVANSGSDNIGIFLGLGGGMFSNQTTYSTGSGSAPYSVAVGDLNNDTVLDLIVANCNTGEIGVLLGNGNGTFSRLTTYPTGYASVPVSLALGDFNGDDRLDVAVVLSNFFSIGIFLGYYNSPFVVPNMYSGGSILTPYAFAIADFDSDNRSDIVTTNFDDGTLAIYSNFVNGTFLNYSVLSTSFITGLYSVAVGDFNNDNQSDIVAANYLSDSIIFFLTSGNGSFRNPISYSTGTNSGPCSVAVGDFNNDGRVDVINANNLDNSIVLFVQYGFGSFRDKQMYSTTSIQPSRSVAHGDFNKDGIIDLVVANTDDSTISVLLGKGNGTFLNPVVYSTGSSTTTISVAVGDLNNDAVLDIVVANRMEGSGENVGVFLGKGDGTFSNQVTYSTGSDSKPSTVALGDFNNDNRTDIVVTNYARYTIGIFLGKGDGTFSNQTEYSTGYDSCSWGVTVGDFNNDGRLDIAVANQYRLSAGVFLGKGDGTFYDQVEYGTGVKSVPLGITVGDFNKDNHLDIAIANYGTDNVGIFFGMGDGTFFNQTKVSTGPVSGPFGVVALDFNKDGNLDLVVALTLLDSIGMCFGDGNGSFSAIVLFGTGTSTYPWILTVSDFNSDGWFDVAVVFGDIGGVGVLLGDQNKMFLVSMKTTTGQNTSPQFITVGDFNHDEYLDVVVVCSESNTIGLFFGYGNGHFSSQITYSTGVNSQPWSLAVGDLNNDTRLDIIVANRNANNIGVFIGLVNGSFATLTTYSTGLLSNPSSVAILDFNKDSKLDIVVANYAANSINILQGNGDGTFSNQTAYLTGYNSHPAWIITSDLDRDEWMDVITSTVGTKNVKILSKLC